jgi:hypothetical protein
MAKTQRSLMLSELVQIVTTLLQRANLLVAASGQGALVVEAMFLSLGKSECCQATLTEGGEDSVLGSAAV